MPTIGQLAALACIWEVTARKPGNVHRERDFADVGLVDFLASAAAVGPVFDQASARPIGETVLAAIRATRQVTASNTNLGIVLLLSPLAAVPVDDNPRPGLERALAGLNVHDSRCVYEAIRLAQPGGMERVAEQDVSAEPTLPLRDIMTLAAGRDVIALQYANGFQAVFDEGVPALREGLEKTSCLEDAIIRTHLTLLGKYPDSLIARKRGPAEAETASRMARDVLAAGWPKQAQGRVALVELDRWLRAEGNARNPGTTADLVTASLFAAMREGIIKVPSTWPWKPESR
jgi:triphosphoribosyl-dephospho-CoA synthase